MEKALCLAVLLFLGIFVASANAAFTSCSIVPPGTCTGALMMKVEGSTNAHASLPNQGSYGYGVCCIANPETASADCSAQEATPVLLLDNPTNAHVQEIGQQPAYTNNVCLAATLQAVPQTVTCSYKTACTGNEVCVISISAESNAHVAECTGTYSYPTKVCCDIQTSTVNQPPWITDITPTPYYVKQGTTVTVRSTADDPNTQDRIKLICGETAHSNNLCPGGSPAPSNPQCTFTAQWQDNNDHTIWCYVKETNTPEQYESNDISGQVHSDNIPPSPAIAVISDFFNQYYGQSTGITFTATATDDGGSGIANIWIYANKDNVPLQLKKTCTSSPCIYTSTPTEFQNSKYDIVLYQADSQDRSGNSQNTNQQRIDLCNLTSVSAVTDCAGSGCLAGNKITVTAQYRGQCGPQGTRFNVVQVDASGGGCIIQRDCGYDPNCISNGINNINPSNPNDNSKFCIPNYPSGPTTCTFDWTIPSVPLGCEGATLNYDFAALYDSSGPPSGQWFDRHDAPGNFRFFGDMTPVVNVVHAPANPTEYDIVTVTATATDDFDVEEVNVSVYTSADVFIDSEKCAPPGTNLNVICNLQKLYAPGTYRYNATALDNAGHLGISTTETFTVVPGIDTTPPTTTISRQPAEIGGLDQVIITATAIDGSGIGEIKVSAYNTNDELIITNTCSSSPCAITVPAYEGGTFIKYNASAADTLGNSINEPAPAGFYLYEVCKLVEAGIAPATCAAGGCVQGNDVTLHAVYEGECPAVAYMQIDASSQDSSCILAAEGGSMTGVQGTCTTTGSFTVCDVPWNVPVVAGDCYGKTVFASFGSINKNSFPPAGAWFDSEPATGSVMFDAPPTIDITHDPPAPIDTDEVEFNATGNDNYDISRIEIFVDNFVNPKTICTPAQHPEQELNCSYRGGPYPLGTQRNYSARIVDSAGFVVQTGITSFTVESGPDLTGPVVTVSHAPVLIGIITPINYTATASDARSGVENISLFINDAEQCFNESDRCYYSEGPLTAGTRRTYNAESYDTSGNKGESDSENFVVCSYDSVNIQPQCGSDNLCRQGETILVNAIYHGACPDPAHLQTDAIDNNNICTIQAQGGDITGIAVSCPGGSCSSPWTIPQVPFKCQGRIMHATASSLRILAGGEIYDIEQPTGFFTFWLDTTGVSFVINTDVSDTTPNYGDIINVSVSCYLYDPDTGEISYCDNEVVDFKNITIDQTIDYIQEESWNQDDNFNNGIWNIPIDTAKYNSLVNVTLRFGSFTNYIENNSVVSYTVNFPPTIEKVSYVPLPIHINDNANFSAIIINPEDQNPSTIDKAYVCKKRNCTDIYCEMKWYPPASEASTFNCTSPPIALGNNYFWIFANDTEGARNITNRFNLLATPEFINITLRLPDAGITIPLTQNGIPNYTRGMGIRVLVNAEIRNSTGQDTSIYLGPCDYTNCLAEYGANRNDYFPWDFFQDSWNKVLPTYKLHCNTEEMLDIIVTRSSDGLDNVKRTPVFINCIPHVVVNPLETRIALGQSNMIIFNVTVYNPYAINKIFNVTFDGGQGSFVNNWIIFDCGNNQHCGTSLDGKTARLDVHDISSETVQVKLISPGRAGSYPLRFIAQDLSDEKKYEARGALQIFSEALPEFELWQLVIVIVIAALLFALITRKTESK